MDRNKVLLVPELVPWVALRKESVDRNCLSCVLLLLFWYVALRKESVDRNIGVGTTRDRRGVALRKESVDRNVRNAQGVCIITVALRKESVDRNVYMCPIISTIILSLSARRAWIEILLSTT